MRVHVRLFASFAETAGWRERDLEIPAGASATDALVLLRKGPLIALPAAARPLFAVNRRHVTPEQVLVEGDELAIFPPVAGGSQDEVLVLLEAGQLDVRRLQEAVRHPSCGAVVVFEGVVRDHADGEAVTAITYEAYESMASEMLTAIATELHERWPSVRVALAHRTGRLLVGETSVVIACAAPHRRAAFAACSHAMDRVKESLPAWKREERASGTVVWR